MGPSPRLSKGQERVTGRMHNQCILYHFQGEVPPVQLSGLLLGRGGSGSWEWGQGGLGSVS